MPTCRCPGEALVGSMTGFNGDGTGQREQTAIQNAYQSSGLTDAYITLVKLAFQWECAGSCHISTRFSIRPAPQTRRNPATGLWEASLVNATLKVWVVCSRATKRGRIEVAP